MKVKKLPSNIEKGTRLRIVRNSNHLTQAQFGGRCGIKEAAIKNRESGLVEIEILFAEKVEKEFGISSHWLLTGEGEMFARAAASFPAASAESGQYVVSSERRQTGVDAKDNFGELMGMAGVVLNSETIFAEALAQNIRAFHHGVDNENDPDGKKKKVPGPLPGAAGGGCEKASG